MSKIIELKAENVKRLSAVEIKPDGNLVVVGGKNGAGKTSVLDSIMYCLAGGKTLPAMPVRKGQQKAEVKLDLGDLIVKRTFTPSGGGALTVTNKEGLKHPSPQAILDGLVGRLSFDPLEFSRQKADRQAETLRQLVGLDFTKQDQEHAKLYEERTVVNREVKNLQSRMVAAPKHEGVPVSEVSTAEILEGQRKASEVNAQNAARRTELENLKGIINQASSAVDSQTSIIAQMENSLVEAKKLLVTRQERYTSLSRQLTQKTSDCAALVDVGIDQYRQLLANTEATNAKVRQNQAREKIVSEFKEKSAQSEALTKRLENLENAKRSAIQKAKYPIEGMAFSDGGLVTLNGIPFEQCSSAEQLRVSIAIGIALNPELRVLLIRDGSLLDEDGLKLVAEMAAKHDAQVWLERVGTEGEISVIIEDGHVQGMEPEPEPSKEKELL